MHYLMLITLTMLPGETSPQARERAYSLLLEDQSFCGDGGRFGSPICDWFVIGGRWSGCLRKPSSAQLYRETAETAVPGARGRITTAPATRRLAAPRSMPSGGNWAAPDRRPSTATPIEHTGYDDDALPVDQASTTACSPSTPVESDGEEGSAAAGSPTSTARRWTTRSSAANGSRSSITTTNPRKESIYES